ncbi:hypothetical protein OS493_027631 [Desmophyllum pertusum]|uniref:CN hydrolase domain-containing protein n=1 Tax=Desmophyllum pertusum TaxID=174260 RepID=A0A9W9ZLF1_9CNID|nr:hypothetical protein OS493_027631 [Desmophyllum pertusum]
MRYEKYGTLSNLPSYWRPRSQQSENHRMDEKAAMAGADLALFGELVLTGCDHNNLHAVSEAKDGPTAVAIATAAKDLGIAVIYGYSEIEKSDFYNSLMFIDKYGRCLANYRKVHICDAEQSVAGYKAGDAVTVVDWEKPKSGNVYRRRSMVLNGGAQFIAISAALSRLPQRHSTTVFVPARALENRCYIAHTDLAGEKFVGFTGLFDPLAQSHHSSDPNTSSEFMLTTEVPLDTFHDVPFHYHSHLRPAIYDAVIPYETEVPWNRQTEERTQEFFNHRADYYDRQMNGMYNAPSVAASSLSEVVNNKNGKLLDIATGTGLIGEALCKKGFKNLVALDRNKKMLEKAAAKKRLSPEEAAKLASGSFHACVCVGAFLTEAWLDPLVTVKEMSRLVECGGYLLLLWNATELEEANCEIVRKNLDAVLKEVVKRGECECLQFCNVPNYLEECEGTLCILKKK